MDHDPQWHGTITRRNAPQKIKQTLYNSPTPEVQTSGVFFLKKIYIDFPTY